MSILKSPVKIGSLELKNRLVMPPMATSKAGDDGRVNQAILDYYEEKSAGGYIGLIITEHSYIAIEGKAGRGQVSVSDDEDIEGLKRLTDVIRQNGSRVMAQLNHAGGAVNREITGTESLAPSAVVMPRTGNVPSEMTTEQIKTVVEQFAKAALRAKKAGYDGVEIHSAHGYLLNQFYSPLTNKRKDCYGGESVEERVTLHLEVIKAVRSAVGEDYPVALRLGACDYREGGSTIEDAVKAAKIFEAAGIDMLDISGGFCGYVNPNSTEQGYFREITEACKKAVKIPVMLTGGITEPEAAERLLSEGSADLIGVGRAILKDSLWARRAIEESGL